MVKHIWSILCARSIIDPNSNNISLIDILERLEVDIAPIKGKPFDEIKTINVPAQYELVSLWLNLEQKAQEVNLLIKLIDPKGKELNRSEQVF